MVDAEKWRFTMLVVCCALLTMVLKCELPQSNWERSIAEIAEKQQHYKAEITQQELDAFISLWPKFQKMGFADNLVVSYKINPPSKFVDWRMKVWFVYQKWDPDRFFYVQQRIAHLLYLLNVQRQANAFLEQLKGRYDNVAAIMMDIQQQRVNMALANAGELELISAKEEELKKLFD